MGSASTMEPASTMRTPVAAAESATAVERVATVDVAAEPAASAEALGPTMKAFTAPKALAAMPAPVTAETIAVTIPAASREAVPAVEAVEPRTRADERAADKVVRAVVAVRRARVWVVAVVTISAGGSRSNISRTWRNPEPDHDLRMSVRGVARKEDQQRRHQSIL